MRYLSIKFNIFSDILQCDSVLSILFSKVREYTSKVKNLERILDSRDMRINILEITQQEVYSDILTVQEELADIVKATSETLGEVRKIQDEINLQIADVTNHILNFEYNFSRFSKNFLELKSFYDKAFQNISGYRDKFSQFEEIVTRSRVVSNAIYSKLMSMSDFTQNLISKNIEFLSKFSMIKDELDDINIVSTNFSIEIYKMKSGISIEDILKIISSSYLNSRNMLEELETIGKSVFDGLEYVISTTSSMIKNVDSIYFVIDQVLKDVIELKKISSDIGSEIVLSTSTFEQIENSVKEAEKSLLVLRSYLEKYAFQTSFLFEVEKLLNKHSEKISKTLSILEKIIKNISE